MCDDDLCFYKNESEILSTTSASNDSSISLDSNQSFYQDVIPPEENNVTEDSTTSTSDVTRWPKYYHWRDYNKELQWALPIHVYGFACLFFMLSFYTFFSILNLRSQLTTRPFMSTINVFVCVLGISRAICFLIDPYSSQRVIPGFLGWVLWDVGYPCILSAFGLIQLAFSQLTQMTFRPESLRKKSSLSLIMAVHFLCVLASNVIASFEHEFELLRVVAKAIFLTWGMVLCFTFLHGGGKILKLLKTLPSSIFHNSEPVAEQHKGILQLALLAQCNNIASSVITAAAAPSGALAPKIKITDENEISIGSNASKFSSSLVIPDLGDQLTTVPEINVSTPGSAGPSGINFEDNNEPVVKIEICEATPETPIKDTFFQEMKCQDESPLRKKSLTWGDENPIPGTSMSPNGTNNNILSPTRSTSRSCAGATLGCDISSSGERRKNRRSSTEGSSSRRGSDVSSSRRSSTVSNASSRRNSINLDPMMGSRKGSYSSIHSNRDSGSRKSSHVGEALVMSRRTSINSDVSSRRGSSQSYLNPGGMGNSTSRRGSSRSVRDDVESESLIRRPSLAPSDVTLSSVLNHIAYVNQTGAANTLGAKVKESRKQQVRQVLVVTYVTAVLGMALSVFLILGFYIRPPPRSSIPPWIWFSYATICRLLEFLIGCAMANITRQPINRHSQYGYSLRMKPHNSIYLG